MPVVLRKLLRIGGLPAEMRADVNAEGTLFLAEYVPVMRHFTGKIPGRRSLGKLSSYVGSLALTEQRLLALKRLVEEPDAARERRHRTVPADRQAALDPPLAPAPAPVTSSTRASAA